MKPTVAQLAIGSVTGGLAAYLAGLLMSYLFHGTVDWTKPILVAVIMAITIPVLAVRQAKKQPN